MPGVLAVGDTRCGSIKRVASAVGEGSMSVQLIHQYLAEADDPPPWRALPHNDPGDWVILCFCGHKVRPTSSCSRTPVTTSTRPIPTGWKTDEQILARAEKLSA